VSSYTVGGGVVAALGKAFVTNPAQTKLETVSDAHNPPKVVLSAPPSKVTAGEFSLTSGRIVWTTDQPTKPNPSALTARQASVGAHGGAVSVSKRHLFARDVAWEIIAASGETTLYLKRSSHNGLPASTVRVVSPERVTSLPHTGPASVSVSGNRVFYRSVQANGVAGRFMLLNSATGQSHPIRALNRLRSKHVAPELSPMVGSYVAYSEKHGIVRRVNVVTGKTVTVGRAADQTFVTNTSVFGPYVAWTTEDSNENQQTYIRNLSAGTPTVALPAGDSLVGLTNDGIVLNEGRSNNRYSLRGYKKGAAVQQVLSAPQAQARAQFSDGVVGWIDAANVVRAAALPDGPITLVSLGAPYAPTHIARSGHHHQHRWRPDARFSAALATCHFTLRRHGASHAKHLSCSPSAMRFGDARTTVNPKHLAHGHYTWSVQAQGTSGTTATQHGKLTVRR
jgi:hypothetical protein